MINQVTERVRDLAREALPGMTWTAPMSGLIRGETGVLCIVLRVGYVELIALSLVFGQNGPETFIENVGMDRLQGALRLTVYKFGVSCGVALGDDDNGTKGCTRCHNTQQRVGDEVLCDYCRADNDQ